MRTIVKKHLTGFRAEKLGGRNFHLSVKGWQREDRSKKNNRV